MRRCLISSSWHSAYLMRLNYEANCCVSTKLFQSGFAVHLIRLHVDAMVMLILALAEFSSI
jgi:hypothetical protein